MGTTGLLSVTTLAVIFLLPLTNALFLHLRHSEQRCFFEEIPYETLVMVRYKLEQWDPATSNGLILPMNKSVTDDIGLGLKALVKDPTGNIILSKTYGKQGRFAFTSHMAGDHVMCVSSNDTSMDGFLRLHVNITIGGYAVDYDIVKAKEKLTALQLQLRKLQDLTQQISKEQDYQRTREQQFRDTSESTNSRVLFFAALQTCVLVMVGVYQVRHLKMFFIVKKLV